MKKIVHIDLNAFFVQAEILRNPSLKGLPVAVGYDGKRGVISTSSYEARAFGVHSGMPVNEAKRCCPNLEILPGDYRYYSLLSHHFFSYLRSHFPILEQASIDECYIDMSNYLIDGEEKDQLFDLQMDLYRRVKLKCSIGYGSNKFLAKMGSDYKKPLGLTLITKDNISKILWPLDIEKMFGVGKKTAPRLKLLGIDTIGSLATCNDERVKKILGSTFDYLKSEANGFGDDEVSSLSFDPKSISAERTFAEDSTSYEELKNMIKSCSADVFKELNNYHKEASVVLIKLRTPDFKTKSKRLTLPSPISTLDQIFSKAMTIFDKTYRGEPIRLIGVGVDKVNEKKTVEENLPSDSDAFLKDINDELSCGGKVFLGSEIDRKNENK